MEHVQSTVTKLVKDISQIQQKINQSKSSIENSMIPVKIFSSRPPTLTFPSKLFKITFKCKSSEQLLQQSLVVVFVLIKSRTFECIRTNQYSMDKTLIATTVIMGNELFLNLSENLRKLNTQYCVSIGKEILKITKYWQRLNSVSLKRI